MILNVINHGLSIGSIELKGISSSSVLLIGDCQSINLSSEFDTPPESLIVASGNALVPLSPR
ncbi:spore gernimation protein GerPD [Pullulanibacillus sp. KACC 23026]|uniref:spore gernimation protein GerPD n=1 Tax=Pullulanibacillus sp. KACC 23026 TaxID=3028315 RepID=UPI0023AE7FF0|nr:spore gernimation protein GerPD [Pullulanibacillus sp. KACC 23026]WEG12333.1 spore gernimation protein GerPD [Pullulanibacillus sp. KACC 23026]